MNKNTRYFVKEIMKFLIITMWLVSWLFTGKGLSTLIEGIPFIFFTLFSAIGVIQVLEFIENIIDSNNKEKENETP